MASFVKYQNFVKDLASGVHQFQTGTTHVLKVAAGGTASPLDVLSHGH